MVDVELTKPEFEELRAYRTKLQADLRLLCLTGRRDSPRGQALEEDLQAVETTLREHGERERKEAAARDREAMARQKREEERREELADLQEEAVEFLQEQLSAGPVEAAELQARADARGLRLGVLNTAAGSLGVLQGRRYGTGSRLVGPVHWGLSKYSFMAGWRVLGRAV